MSTDAATHVVREGDIIAGKYRVERVLGVGGMGVVVAAHHIQLDEKVALKFLLPDALLSGDAVARFVREARAAARIKSEHVARVTDVGQLENGLPYMVMEYLDGSDLANWLERQGPLPIDQAVDFVLHACEALAQAHLLGIVHRDLKPSNLFCVHKADGTLSVKVLDFGISKFTSSDTPLAGATKTTAFLGSPLYASPEQMRRAKSVDARADIWSLGVTLFELLTARQPFDGEGLAELVLNVATLPPLSVRDLRPEVPEGLERVILRCLEKDREHRFQSVGEVAMAAQSFATARGRLSVDAIVATLARAKRVSPPSSPPDPMASSAALAVTAKQPAGSFGGRARGRTAMIVTLGCIGAGTLAMVYGISGSGRHSAVVSPAAVPAAAPAVPGSGSAPTPAASQTAPAEPLTMPATSNAAVPAISAQVPRRSTPAAAPAPGAPKAKNATVARAMPSAAPPSQPDCNPKYYFDEAGGKHYKPECYE